MSEIITDKLTGRATANDVTVTVGATATQSLEQGLAKAWANLDANDNPPTFDDSLNLSTGTDVGAGRHNYSFVNLMSNANYSIVATTSTKGGGGTNNAYSYDSTTGDPDATYGPHTTSNYRINNYISSGSIALQDPYLVHSVIFGDLA